MGRMGRTPLNWLLGWIWIPFAVAPEIRASRLPFFWELTEAGTLATFVRLRGSSSRYLDYTGQRVVSKCHLRACKDEVWQRKGRQLRRCWRKPRKNRGSRQGFRVSGFISWLGVLFLHECHLESRPSLGISNFKHPGGRFLRRRNCRRR